MNWQPPLQLLTWSAAAFLCGAIPFSVVIGKLALRTDIRAYGDGNPGATNVLRASASAHPGAKAWGLLAMVLDMAKGALPVAIAYEILDIRDFRIVPIALAPVLGHMASPFLRWHGGKGVAVTGGIWIGLTQGIGAIVGIVLMSIGYALLEGAGWAVALGMAAIGVYLVAWHCDRVLLVVWITNTLLILWRHRDDLRTGPAIRHRRNVR